MLPPHFTHINVSDIHICFATNDRFASHAAALVASIMSNKNASDEITFHFLSDKTSPHVQNSFREMSRQWGFTLNIVEVSDEPFKDFPAWGEGGNRACYFRIFMDRLIPQSVDKVLYLDCDMIVMEPLGRVCTNLALYRRNRYRQCHEMDIRTHKEHSTLVSQTTRQC